MEFLEGMMGSGEVFFDYSDGSIRVFVCSSDVTNPVEM